MVRCRSNRRARSGPDRSAMRSTTSAGRYSMRWQSLSMTGWSEPRGPRLRHCVLAPLDRRRHIWAAPRAGRPCRSAPGGSGRPWARPARRGDALGRPVGAAAVEDGHDRDRGLRRGRSPPRPRPTSPGQTREAPASSTPGTASTASSTSERWIVKPPRRTDAFPHPTTVGVAPGLVAADEVARAVPVAHEGLGGRLAVAPVAVGAGRAAQLELALPRAGHQRAVHGPDHGPPQQAGQPTEIVPRPPGSRYRRRTPRTPSPWRRRHSAAAPRCIPGTPPASRAAWGAPPHRAVRRSAPCRPGWPGGRPAPAGRAPGTSCRCAGHARLSSSRGWWRSPARAAPRWWRRTPGRRSSTHQAPQARPRMALP